MEAVGSGVEAGVWHTSALMALRRGGLSGRRLKRAQYQTLWVDRPAACARADGDHAPVLQESEAASSLIKRRGHGEIAHMGAAVFHRRTYGMEHLAKRLWKL